MSSVSRKVVFALLVFALVACVLVLPAFAQQQSDPKVATNPLVQLLQTKGILTPEEAALVTQASSPAESNQLLAKVLLRKGLISEEEYNQTVAASMTPVVAQGSSDARMIPAVLHMPPRNPSGSAPVAMLPQGPKEPPVIPAVSPVRVLPIDLPKQGGLIPDIKLGSGAKLKLYGFFKASAIEDTANAGGANFGGDDFPLPLLQGDTGPTAGPEFHIKARSFRMGANFEWVPKDSPWTLTGRLEYDFEGDFTNVNNRNISGVRSSTPGIRLAWVRLDRKLGEVPWFAEFGQDWTILGSSTLPSLFESTGLGLGMGSFYERVPQFRTGVQFSSGRFKIQPEGAIVLPVAANSTLTDEQRTRFGDRAGSDSNQPGIQGRVVFQFPLSTAWKGVAPAQIIFSGGHAKFTEVIPAGNLPNFLVAGAVGCTKPATGGVGCGIQGFFPRGLQLDTPQNIWTAEVQLPTPWVTFVSKYYNGGDMRFYFAGQLADAFADLSGVPAIVIPAGVTAPASFSGRVIPFGLTGAGAIVNPRLRPVHGQGGFAEVSFPLSRIFHADPEGHNTGWVLHGSYGTDRTRARDSRRSNGLIRTDLESASLTYKLNAWVTFVNEASYIVTRASTVKTFRGIPAFAAHEWRNEFGTVFTF